VENHTKRFVELSNEAIARLRANAKLGNSRVSMTSQEHAAYVKALSGLIGTQKLKLAPKIAGVKQYRVQKEVLVYELTVEEAHSFFANGVLVSNCDALQYLCLGVNMAGGTGLQAPKRREVKALSSLGWT
jgi:hypothetical protein